MIAHTFFFPAFRTARSALAAALLLASISGVSAVPTTLAPGEVAIAGYNTDNSVTVSGPDSFSFVLLRAIGSGTQIFFSDRNWTGSAFPAAGGGEGTYTYTAGSDLPAGTTVIVSSATLSSAGMDLSDALDTLYVYQGSINSPTTFLFAIDMADGNNTFNGNLTGTGLAAGTNAVAVAANNASFAGPTTPKPANTGANLLTDISDFNSWAGNDNSNQVDLSGTFLSAPDQQLWVASSPPGLIRINRDGSDIGALQVTVFQNPPNPPTQLNHPNEILFDTVHGLYFVADSDTGNRRILQGNIADLMNNPGNIPTFTVLYTDQTGGTTGGQINGLAIDVDGANASSQGHLYFVNKGNFNRITYNYNGASATNQTPTLLAQLPAGSFANEIALDIAGHRAWVLSTAANSEAFPAPGDTPPCEPPNLYDPDCDCCYFIGTSIGNNEIWQVSGLDRTDTGTADTTFARLDLDLATANGGAGPGAANGTGYDLPNPKGFLQGIDVDATAGLLYLVTQQYGGGTQGTGGIYTYNLANGAVTNLYAETTATDYAFEYIDVDPVSGRYYVSNVSFDENNNMANTSSILVHALNAGTPTQFATSGNVNSAGGLGLTVTNAPILSLTQLGLTATYTEQAGSPSSAGAGVTLITSATAADLDTTSQAQQLAGATVRISNNFVSGDSLTFTNSGGVTGSYNLTTGVLTFTGASTFASYQTVLASVKFTNAGDNPTDYGNKMTRTIAWSVSDGLLSSDEQTSAVNVVGVNDAPVNAFPGAQAVNEDTNLSFPGLSVNDVDANPASQQLTTTLSVLNGTLTVLSAGGAGVSGSGTATVTLTGTRNQIHTTLSAANNVVYRGVQDYFGPDTLTFTTNDQGNTGTDPGLTGNATSEQDSDMVGITVNPVNDAPTLAAVSNPAAILEDATQQTVNLSGISEGPANESSQTLTVTAASGNTAVIPHPTVSFTEGNTTGSLSYTPVANGNGSAVITVTVMDNGGTASGGVNSVQRTFTVNVTAVNDAPTLNAISDTTILEDAAQQTVNLAGITNGPNETGQTNTVTATSDNTGLIPNPTVTYTSPNATGSISFTPVGNQNGSAIITVTVSDNGGTANGGVNTFMRTFTINVTAVNDAPTLNAIGNPGAIAEDAAEQSVDLSGITNGPNESGQTMTVTALSDNTALIPNPTVTYTSPQATGSLAYTPIANANGSAIITVTVTDNGPTGGGNVNTFQRQFTVNVNAVNDAPSITGQLAVSTEFNSARTLMFSDLQVTDIDNGYPTGFTLTSFDGTNYTRSGNQITPALNFFGTLSVGVKVNDGGLDSNTFSLAMTVNPSAAMVKSGAKIEAQAGGGYKISFIGNPGQQYTVQSVDFLPATLAQWNFISFQTADANGTFSITVPAPGVPVRFYRAIVP